MSVRALLLYPPSRTQSHTSCPAGLLHLAAVLEASGYTVKIVDANASCRRRSTDELVAIAREFEPDVIGMTIVTQLAKQAYHLSEKLKPLGAPLLAGGPHPTIVPDEPLRIGFDAVVVGEGETVIVPAVEYLLSRRDAATIPGLVYRDRKGEVRSNPMSPFIEDLEHVLPPARHLVPAEEFRAGSHPDQYGNIFSSRGCPCKCSYCAGGLFGRRFRFRKAEHVVAEIAGVHHTYKTHHFHFVDDGMTEDRARVHEICERLLSLQLPITWSMMTRIDSVDAELLDISARAGCVRIDYGVESGHAETLKRIHKPHNVAMVKEVIAATRKSGITPCAFFILGFPWETPEHIRATMTLMQELSPYLDQFHPALASLLIPFPGTEIYDQYKDEYDLKDWWLRPNGGFGVPQPGKHAYFEDQFFRFGAVLDADFFRYSPEVKAAIYDTFRFMHRHNNLHRPPMAKHVSNGMVDLSLRLWRMSPRIERTVMGGLHKLTRVASGASVAV